MFSVRMPSLSKSIGASFGGQLTRQLKRSINPLYGRHGMGLLNPKKCLYNKLYHATTMSVGEAVRTPNFDTPQQRKEYNYGWYTADNLTEGSYHNIARNNEWRDAIGLVVLMPLVFIVGGLWKHKWNILGYSLLLWFIW